MVWGGVRGLASLVPFVGPPIVIGIVAVVGMITFDDWYRIVAAPAALLVIHFTESQLVTPAFVSRRCALNTVAGVAPIRPPGVGWGGPRGPLGGAAPVPVDTHFP